MILLFLLISIRAACAQQPASQPPLTLEQAIAEARAANAQLPVAAAEVAIAQQKILEARAQRWLKISTEGDFIYSPTYDPILTNLGEERAQVVGEQPLYQGGALRAAVSKASADLNAKRARFQIAQRDVDLEVRNQFSEILAADREIEARQAGLDRLGAYRTILEGRKAAGEGIEADILRTDVRAAIEQSDLNEAQERAGQARLALNDLLGRNPETELVLAPLPEPRAKETAPQPSWETVPEIVQADAEMLSAQADVRIAQAEHKLHLFARADAGLWGSDTEHLIPPDLKASHPGATLADRLHRDAGYSISLNFSWPIWQSGAIEARIAQARLNLEEASGRRTLEWRHARLEWEKARESRAAAFRQIEILSRALPTSRDLYLATESRYRGGVATSLEVLDAYAGHVDAEIRLAQATLRCRLAEALEERWGSP